MLKLSPTSLKRLSSLPNESLCSFIYLHIVATLQRLRLKDVGSLHGTFLNESDQRLEKDHQVEIKDGDTIRFGVDIMRKKTFPPTVVKLGVDYLMPTANETIQ